MVSDEQYGPKTRLAKETHARKHRNKGESFKESCTRVAQVLGDSKDHFFKYRQLLLEQKFLNGGRVHSSIGSPRQTTALNCFVSATIPDSMDGIMEVAKQAAQTMRLGGGIGYDFSTIRPRGGIITTLGSQASGAVSFMEIFNAVCGTVASAGDRRGAMMGVIRIDHPDIDEFIEVKCNEDELTNFNISCAITDEFMETVENKSTFELKFDGKVYGVVSATALYDKLMRASWDWGEPGILFIDQINRMNNLHYCETIAATNP